MSDLTTTRARLETIPVATGGTRRAWVGIMVLFALVYVGSAFSPSLQDDADSTHAEAAREMYVTGDYVTLHVNGVRYLEKAPLLYWTVAGGYHVFGVNEFATHFPTLLAVFLLMLLAMRWGERAYGERAGMYAGLFVCTTAGYYLFTRILIPEAVLSLLIGAALYFFASALEADGNPRGWKSARDEKEEGLFGAAEAVPFRNPSATGILQQARGAWRWYAGYACLALAVLTKGLLALVVVGGAATAYLALSGEWRRWREFRIGSGVLLFFVMAAPWHLLAGWRNPRFFWFYFVNEHFLRFLGERYPKDYNKLPASLYWSLHLLWLFPWSVFLPLAGWRLIREFRGNQGRVPSAAKAAIGREASFGAAEAAPFQRSEGLGSAALPRRAPYGRSIAATASRSFSARTQLLCAVWAAVMLVFFAFSTNQEYYTVPAYLPILLLLAGAVTKEEGRESRWLLWTTAGAALLWLAGAGILVAGLWNSRHLPFVPDIGTVLAKPNLKEETLSMGHMLELTGESFAALRLPAMLAVLALGAGAILMVWLRARRRHFASTWAMAAAMGLFLMAAHVALVRFDPYLSSKHLAGVIARESRSGDRVMIYGDQAFGSSLLFYLQRPIELVNGRTTSMWFGSTYADAPKIFLDDAALLRAWESGERVFLFVPQHQRAHVDRLLPDRKFAIAESSGKVVYSNFR